MTSTTADPSAVPAQPVERPTAFDPPVRAMTGQLRRLVFPRGVSAWMVSDYDVAKQVLGDEERFSSAEAPFAHVMDDWDLGSEPPQGAIVRSGGTAHHRLRAALLPEFTMRAMRTHVPAFTAIADGLASDILSSGGPIDLVEAFARPMASRGVCTVLGLPAEYAAQVQECADAANSAVISKAERHAADAHLRQLIAAQLGDCLDRTRTGLLPQMFQTAARAEPRLSLPEMITLGTMLATAGLKENTSQISLTVAMLLHRGSWPTAPMSLESCLDLAESSIDWLAIIQWGINRVAAVDCVVAGIPIAAGDLVVISLPHVNHDAVGRGHLDHPAPGTCPGAAGTKVKRHLAFGYGPHQCLGANLARVELAVSLMVLSQRFPTLVMHHLESGPVMSPVWSADRVMVGWDPQ